MREITIPARSITVYTFQELRALFPQAAEHVRERYNSRIDGTDLQDTIDEIAALLERCGWGSVEIAYDLSCSQGSGACFYNRYGCRMGIPAIIRNAGRSEWTNWKVWADVLPFECGIPADQLLAFAEYLEETGNASAEVRLRGRYTHEHSSHVEYDIGYVADEWEAIAVAVGDELERIRLHTCRTIYRLLQEGYTYLQADERITEETSHVMFDEHGEEYPV